MIIEESTNLDIMRVDELMGTHKTFELNLTQRKKEKSIALKTMQEAKIEDGNDQDDDKYALLSKNFNKFFRKVGKQSKSALKALKSTKGKASSKPTYFF